MRNKTFNLLFPDRCYSFRDVWIVMFCLQVMSRSSPKVLTREGGNNYYERKCFF